MKRYSLFLITILVLLLAFVSAANAWEMTYDDGMGGTSTVEIDPSSCFNIDPDKEPTRKGYRFVGWELDYERTPLSVSYEVTGDAEFGTPEGAVVPADDTVYYAGDTVTVADDLTSDIDFAYDSLGRKWPGTWTFSGWDKDDFTISEDTTIRGSWTFVPGTWSYIVEYIDWATGERLLPDETVNEVEPYSHRAVTARDIDGYEPVNAPVEFELDEDHHLVSIYYDLLMDYTVRYVLESDKETDLKEPLVQLQVQERTVHLSPAVIPGYKCTNPNAHRYITINFGMNVYKYFYTPELSVSYEVTGDAEFGTPEGAVVPADDTVYYAGDTVTVADDLTSDIDFAYDDQGRKWVGTWSFSGWDKDDFTISEDTTITGSWTFEPEKWSYTVRYLELGTDKQMLPDTIVPDQEQHSHQTVTAPDLDRYYVVEDPVEFDLEENGQLVVMYYDLLIDYTVRYVLESDKETDLRDPEVHLGAKLRTIHLTPAEIPGYKCTNPNAHRYLTIDSGMNVYKYFYTPTNTPTLTNTPGKKVYITLLSYDLFDNFIQKDVIEAEAGFTTTVNPVEIKGYLALDPPVTLEPKGGEEITFIYIYVGMEGDGPTTSLTIRCVNEETGEDLPAGEVLEDLEIWSEVTVAAPEIEGFYVTNGTEQTRTVVEDTEENEVIFWYAPEVLTSYEVRFEGDDTEEPIAESLIREEILSGSTVTETAPEIENYEFDGEDEEKEQKLVLTNDAEANVLTFRYKRLRTDAEVRYEDADGEMLELPKELKDLPVGGELEEEAPLIPGCEADEAYLSLTLQKDPEDNILIFTYSSCSGSPEAEAAE